MNKFFNNNKKRTVIIKFFTVTIVLFLFIGFLNLFNSGLKNIFYKASFPLQKILINSSTATASVFQSIFNAGKLQKENDNLKQENQNLLAKISILKNLTEQDFAVKEILSTCQPKDLKLALANVIGFNAKNDFITIDKGSNDEILENMPVINQQKALFGKIFKVYKNYSEVILISNKNSVLDATTDTISESSNPAHGIVKGMGNLAIFLDLVPIESEIKEGDILTTSALDGVFPKDLLIGKIRSKNKNELKPFQTAEVQPFFDPKKTDKLFVILDYKQ